MLGFLIPLVKMLYLVIGTTPQDRILIAQKLTKLLNFDPCEIGRGSLLLVMGNPSLEYLEVAVHNVASDPAKNQAKC